jgi:hypothetical protein
MRVQQHRDHDLQQLPSPISQAAPMVLEHRIAARERQTFSPI